jgi:hypothetical protein
MPNVSALFSVCRTACNGLGSRDSTTELLPLAFVFINLPTHSNLLCSTVFRIGRYLGSNSALLPAASFRCNFPSLPFQITTAYWLDRLGSSAASR